ncbi:hypothetical protein EH223_17140 [candidate division KSB1 bacterium]|nr:hypothetical protein [candidate division KSB1 bacterium]RQW00876.1 MAG: hypothetical protein EH223_17140 [candidate division KSB1 bacterium]
MDFGIILLIVSLFSLGFWRLFGTFFSKVQKGVRRFFLFLFLFGLFPLYYKYAMQFKDFILNNWNLNYILSQLIDEFKGTDWADGLLTATFFFVYIVFCILLWNKEKKESKKKEDAKPFKIEARIGNVKE